MIVYILLFCTLFPLFPGYFFFYLIVLLTYADLLSIRTPFELPSPVNNSLLPNRRLGRILLVLLQNQ